MVGILEKFREYKLAKKRKFRTVEACKSSRLLYQKCIGENIRKIRERLNLTQQDCGEFLGITYQQVQKYENGKDSIKVTTLYGLTQFFEVPIVEFFEGLEGLDLERGENDE
jgi:DNA-binding XRE family transcriptional regulator